MQDCIKDSVVDMAVQFCVQSKSVQCTYQFGEILLFFFPASINFVVEILSEVFLETDLYGIER